MADIVLSTFQRASFRGVPFLFKEQSQTGGRKNKVFEFPNRDTRETQDLGKLQKSYKMTATIADNTSSYKASKQRFVDALEQQGSGKLVHPTDGVKTVFALPYVLDEAISHTGTAIFIVTFIETGEQEFPTESSSYAANIVQQLNSFVFDLNSDFSEVWAANAKFQGNVEYSANLIQGLVNQFENAGNIVTNDLSAYNTFVDEYTKLSSNRYLYTNDSNSLTASVSTLFSSAGQLTDVISDSLTIFASFFSYDPVVQINSTTVGTDQREQNRLATNQLINAQALVYYYLFVAIETFDTDLDIQSQHTIMNGQFSFVITNNIFVDILGNRSDILSNSTLSLLETLRFNAHESLNAQTAATRKVSDITIKNESLISLVFNYYGNLDFYGTIYQLNDLTGATNLVGDFKVLTDAD